MNVAIVIVIVVLHLGVAMLFLSQFSSLVLPVIVIVVHHRALILSLNFRPQMVLYIHQLCGQETLLHQLVMIHLLGILLLRIQTYLRHRIFHHRI
jgi:hypothetical protein